jgi:hypothetical protein
MKIDKIYNNGDLSIRSYHACKYNEIDTITDLKYYYSKHQTFINFRNCGKKSNLELIDLCNTYPYVEIPSLKIIIQKLNRPQRQVINQFIKITTSNLKVRGRNAITMYIGKPLKVSDFLIKIFDREDFQVAKINNIGKAYIPELKTYLDKLKTFINEVSNISSEKKLVSLSNKFLIQHTFSIDVIPDEILENQSIIKLCEFLILKNAFFKPDYNTIFYNTIDVFNSECKTLDETAINTNLTRERVRQIRQRCFVELENKISFLKNFEDDFYQNYEIDISENFIILTNEKVEEINFLYDTNISRNFLIYIFSVYLSEQFSINGNLDDVLIPKQMNARNRHNWKNIYIISKEIKKEIDIDKICEDIYKRQLETINETYKFNFKSYLSRFLLTENFRILEEIKDYCEVIINEEFDLFLDLNDNIVFSRTNKKTLPEYITEILEELGEPTTVEDIYAKLEYKNPKLTKSAEALRGSCQRAKNLIYFGRSSTYGLKKWEKEKENIKGGTIRSIVKEYLDNSSTPLHISEITNYVLKFRPKSNEHSIIQNLKLDNSKVFKFFQNGFVGVFGKKYESSFVFLNSHLKPIPRDWEDSYKLITDFIEQNGMLPRSTKNHPKSEQRLYRWLNNQKNKINENRLNLNQTNRINEIFSENYTKPIANIETKYERLIEFIETHKRLPKRSVTVEKKLANFYGRQLKLLSENKLNKDKGDKIRDIKNNFKTNPEAPVKKINSKETKYDLLLDFVKSNNSLPSSNNEYYYLNKFFFKQQNQFYLMDEAIKKRYLEIKNLLNKNYENTRN